MIKIKNTSLILILLLSAFSLNIHAVRFKFKEDAKINTKTEEVLIAKNESKCIIKSTIGKDEEGTIWQRQLHALKNKKKYIMVFIYRDGKEEFSEHTDSIDKAILDNLFERYVIKSDS